MRRMRTLGMVVVAVCAMSALAVPVANAALVFNSTVVGKLTAKSLTTQTFNTEEGAVECTAVQVTQGEAALSSKTQEATIQYEKCKAFGLSATVSPALYEFDANGSVAVLNTITVNAGLGTCVVHVPAAGNGTLRTIKYDNEPAGIIILPNVTNILYIALTGCPKPGHFTNGTYTGNVLVAVVGGVVSWIP